jgi:hypothetical protein
VVIETEGAEFCPHHLRQAKEYGAEMVRAGAVPKRRARSIVANAGAPTTTTGPEVTATVIAPANVVTVECPSCGARSRIEDSVAEVSARLAAIEHLLVNLPRAGGGLADAPEQGREPRNASSPV